MSEESKTRVLFVDDEFANLNRLEQSLCSMAEPWQLDFAQSGSQALESMARNPAQVVVCDLNMPGMDGGELLARIKDQYPQAIRVIIAEHTDREALMKCVGTAHQFLSKPCHPDELRLAINRANEFKFSAKSERIQEMIGKMECLPSIPSLLQEALGLLRQDDPDIERIGKLVSRDIGLTTRLLRLVNSAFFGLQVQVTNPTEAISYLGLDPFRALMLSVQAFAAFEKRKTGPIAFDALWAHSLKVADLAAKIERSVARTRIQSDESFLAGMLHDVGKLALAVNLPDLYQHVFAAAENLGLSLHAAEEAAFGGHHGDVGGQLLSLWGLPQRVVAAISYHHEPQLVGVEGFTPAAAVHIANALIHEAEEPRVEFLRAGFVEELGVAEHLAAWRKWAVLGRTLPLV